MDLGPALPTELLSAADPLARGLPDVPRPPGRDPDASPALAPFDLLLQLLGNGLPGGQALPAGGAVPPVVPDTAPDHSPLDDAIEGAVPDPLMGLPWPVVAAPLPLAEAGAAEPTAAAALPLGDRRARPVAFDAAALALANAARSAAVPGQASGVADPAGAAASDDAQSALPQPNQPPAAQPVDTSAGLEALRALDLAARSAPPPDANPGLRADERAASRDRAPLAFALEHAAQSSSNDVARQQTTAPRGLELAAPAVAAPGEAPAAAAKTARLDEPAPLTLATTPAAGDAAAAGATGFAPLAAQHGSGSAAPAGATAQPAGQLPPHLQTPVDAQAARWHDALASRIQWLVDHDVGEAQIKLNPPELGAIDVKVSMLDDKTFVQMTAQSAAARDELSHSLPRLRELLSAGGLDLGGATVSGGRDERGAYQAAPAPVSRAASFAAAASEAIDAVPRARLSSAARIDTFA